MAFLRGADLLVSICHIISSHQFNEKQDEKKLPSTFLLSGKYSVVSFYLTNNFIQADLTRVVFAKIFGF